MTNQTCKLLTCTLFLTMAMACNSNLCAEDTAIDLSAFGAAPDPAPTPEATPDPAPAVVTPAPPPPTPVAVPTTTPAQPQPVAATTPAPVVIDVAAYKTEVDAINAQIQKIITSKDALKDLLKTVDSGIQECKDRVTASRKKSLEVMTQKEAPAAQALLTEIEGNTKFITEQQTKISAISDTQFQAEVDKIEAAKQLIDTQIKQLKAKGIAIQEAQARVEQATANAELLAKKAAPKRHFKSWFVKNKDANSGATADQPTFIHYAFTKIADAVSSAMQWVYETCISIKASIWSTTPAAVVGGVATTTPTAPQPATQAQPVAAGTPPAATSALSGLEKQDSATQALMTTQDKLAKQIASVDSTVQTLTRTLNSNEALAKNVVGEGVLQKSMQQPAPAWKLTAQGYFGMLLDGFHHLYIFVSSTIGRLYYLYIAPLFIKVSNDVQKEVQKQTNQLVVPNAPIAPTATPAEPIKAAEPAKPAA